MAKTDTLLPGVVRGWSTAVNEAGFTAVIHYHLMHSAGYTRWRRINWTIQTFNQVYENLHKITNLTPVAHRQIRRQKINVHFLYCAVINILCDVIVDVIHVNMKTHPLTSASSCARICGTRKVAAE